MKKFLLAFLTVMLVAGVAIAEDKIEEIPFSKVPDLGQRIVKSYFPDCNVVKVEKNKSKNMKNRTRVYLDNDASVEFDKDGNWMVVDCRSCSVPRNMINGIIQMYLNKNNPGTEAVYMSREKMNGEITIILNDGTELQFTE